MVEKEVINKYDNKKHKQRTTNKKDKEKKKETEKGEHWETEEG